MAADVRIAINDEAAARAWLENVMDINEQFHTAMTEAGETLQQTKEMADGTIVDELYDMGTDFLHVANKVFETINEISTTVNTVLSKLTSFSDTVSGVIKGVAGLFGM